MEICRINNLAITAILRIIKNGQRESTVLMTKHRKDFEAPKEKSERRGRPPTIGGSEVYGRAESFRDNLAQVWDRLWPLLSNAHSEAEVTKAFQDGASPYDRYFVPGLSALTLQVLRESTLPKGPKPLQRFLADSLAGVGVVTPRRSRDICAQERAERKRAHHILRVEFFIVCSCGYKGHSKNHGCPKCGAGIPFSLGFGNLI
jgi:hypothetical protein